MAARKEKTMLIADCIPDDYESIHPRDSDYLKNRRPDLYEALVAKTVGSEITYPEYQN